MRSSCACALLLILLTALGQLAAAPPSALSTHSSALPSLLPPCASPLHPDLFVIPPSVYTDLDLTPPSTPPSPPLFSSIHDALAFVTLARPDCSIVDPTHRITVQLYPTTHYIDHPLHLTTTHSSLHLTTMHPSHQCQLLPSTLRHRLRTGQPSRATISAGLPITNWTRQSADLYTATLPPRLTGVVNQLFIDGRRVPRSRVPSNYSEYLQYDAALKDQAQARYGFQYAEGQFNYSREVLDEAMVVVYHSWTTSHHYIDHLLPSNRTVIFSNPCGNYIGFFGPQANRRFHLENIVDALTANTFAFINRTRTLYLRTDGSYEPSHVTVVTPVHDSVMNLAGNDAQHPLHDVLINGIAIQHAGWSVARDQQADNQAASWLPSAALLLANVTGAVVTGVEVSHTGQYGVYIKEGAVGVDVLDSLITDTGAGGVRIGQMQFPIAHPTSAVAVIGTEVSYGGNVFPDGVAIISHRASTVAIVDCHVHHHRYSGISVGWSWGYADPSGTENVLIQGNFIHDIGQHLLNDQGGIYLLGIQRGTLIHSNVIANVYSYACFMWGIYLDEGSSEVVVANNVVYETGWASLFQHYGANQSVYNNVFARASSTDRPYPGGEVPDGMVHISIGEPHISWTFAHNIVYDTSPAQNRSAFASQLGVIAPFNDNVYFNTHRAQMLFGAPPVTFAEWQKAGHDANSLIADPLFASDVAQCDFFTLRPDSPAAQRGFVNLTKPSMWTPGCITDETGVKERQFYHWRK